MRTRFWRGKLNETDHVGDVGVDGMIILKCILQKYDGTVKWILLVQDMDQWWAVVNTLMNLQVPYNF